MNAPRPATLNKTIIARTHRGEQVALLEHERVHLVRVTPHPEMDEVRLIDRSGSPLCYVPGDALTIEGAA